MNNKKGFVRYPITFMAVFLAVVLALGATLVFADDTEIPTNVSGLTITRDTSCAISNQTETGFTVTVNGGGSCSSWSLKTGTVTFTNNTDGAMQLSFDYTTAQEIQSGAVSPTHGLVKIDDKTVTAANGSQSITIPAGGAVKMTITSPSHGSESKEKVALSNLSVSYPVWVGGTQVSSANATDTTEHPTWSYDADTNTLTLDNFDNSGAVHTLSNGYDTAAIYAEKAITIALSGTNTVTQTTSGLGTHHGVYVASGDLTITGTGSVNVTSTQKSIYVKDGDLAINSGSVIASSKKDDSLAAKNVTISGGTVTTESSSTCIYAAANGAITISGGTVTATGTGTEGCNGITAVNGNVTISGGTVTVTSAGTNNYSYGIYTYNGNVTISGNSTKAIVSCPNQAISGTVKNEISGSGWTDAEGNTEQAIIAVSSTGQTLDYKRVQFPVAHDHVFSNYALSTVNAANDTITATCTADYCPLKDGVATLTISAPTQDSGNAAVLTANAEGVFGDLSTLTINYSSDGGNSWTTTAPSGEGFYRAKVEWTPTGSSTYSAQVTYGRACIAYADNLTGGTVSGSADATVGATITPTITPDTGYEVDTLTVKLTDTADAVSVTDNERFVMPEANVTVSATFKKINYAITTVAEHGTVTASKDENPVSDANPAQYEDTITLSNTSAEGYQLSAYSVTKTGDSNTTVDVTNGTFQMPAYPVTVTATYTAIDYNVNVSDSIAHGTVKPSKTSEAHIGETITLTMTPDAGYSTDSVSVTYGEDGTASVSGTGDTRTFTMPASDVTASATFAPIDYTVTVAETTNGTVTASKAAEAHVGDEITLTVTPASGYALDVLEVKDSNDQDVPVTGGKFTMPAGNVTVTATFDELAAYTIFYRASGNPGSVKFRMTDSGDGNNMTNSAKLGDIDCWAAQISAVKDREKFSVAFKEGDGEWADLSECTVVDDITDSNLEKGSVVIVKGETKAFIVSFLWSDIAENDSTGSYQASAGSSKNFLVTNNTTSVSVQDPAKTGYTFLGWDDGKSFKQSSNGTVNISGISENTIFAARWRINTSTVTYNLNGGSGSAPNATVNYGDKITAPANPTKAGYAFVRWVVANTTTQQIGGQVRRLSAGTAFDFNNTEIINHLTLKAEWKHAHSYVCLPLDHTAFGGAFKDFYGYKGQLHIKVCTSMDDYSVEAHSFVNGKCTCGASVFDDKVSLTKTIDGDSSTMQAIKNSVVSISAPSSKNNKQFTKWQYSTDGSNWSDLTANPYVAFVIPSDLQVKAVYNGREAKLSVSSFLYNRNLAFQFTYSVPDGLTVVDAGLLTGNNSHIKYMDAKQLVANVSGMADIMFPYIETTDMPVHYDPAKDDAVKKFGAAKVAEKMFREEALNVSGNSNPIFKRCAVLGKTGTAALAINTSGDNIYYYGMGYVICKNSSGNLVVFMTDAISATKTSPDHTASSTNPVQ